MNVQKIIAKPPPLRPLDFDGSACLQTKFADDAWLAKIWLKAVHDAALETGITKFRFPQTPIWAAEQILNGQFVPA